MTQAKIIHEAQVISIAMASAELCATVYDLIAEAEKQGVELPSEFRVWMSRMTAQRSRSLLEMLAWRCYRAGIDNSSNSSQEERPTQPPTNPH